MLKDILLFTHLLDSDVSVLRVEPPPRSVDLFLHIFLRPRRPGRGPLTTICSSCNYYSAVSGRYITIGRYLCSYLPADVLDAQIIFRN